MRLFLKTPSWLPLVRQKIVQVASPLLPIWRGFHDRLRKIAVKSWFRRLYLLGSIVVLALTTLYWAILGARLQSGNADQLSDPYLFTSAATLHGATFPGTHTFLLKWPIFWLVKLFGTTTTSLEAATVVVVLLTIGALAALLYRIERRPLIFGTICLSMALALLLVPAQPYAGGLLPVNMAMLTTRNLEYIAYVIALICFVRAERFRSRNFAWGVGVLAVLIASDKLFLSLSAGGALLALVAYALVRNWGYVTLSVRWLAGTIFAAVGSMMILALISLTHLTHLANESGANPYNLVTGAKNVILGISYAILGLFTNAGANPVYDNKELAQLPAQLLRRVFCLSGLAHLVAAGLLLYALLLVWRQIWPALRSTPRSNTKRTQADQLSVAVVWSSVAAFAVFVGTNHYYAVDARYLTITLFALPIVAVTVLRKRKFRPEHVVSLGLLLVAGTVAGLFAAHGSYAQQKAALAGVNGRNGLVAQALAHHKVDVLVGDYWRVLPAKADSGNTLNVLPLSGCSQPRDTLSSSVWQPNLSQHSFAYLISLDSSLTDFPHCTLPEVTAAYGRPNATQIIAGTLAKPKEVLLFYDHGSRKSAAADRHVAASTVVLPISTDDLMGTNCSTPTIMTVVAHEDDDVLFTNPDLLHDIQAGHCIRTVFLTAGDSGNGKFYWLNRQIGAEAAYDSMLGHKAIWAQHTVQLAENEYVTIASPQNNPKVSLVFFNLPDGGLQGDGFPAAHHESLEKLRAGTIPVIHAVDAESSYTVDQLTAALSSLMNTYQPAEIRTQADVASEKYPDHSDHIATGQFVVVAAVQYDQEQFGGAITIPLKRYIGYPIHGYENNVWGADLQAKEAAFLAYAQYDGGVCHTLTQCVKTSTYGAYIPRQYQETDEQ